LISLVYYEEPYRERATIVLDNHDRALDPGTLDLRGQYFEIGYGYNTTSGDKYSLTPGLWVKSQHAYSSEGVTICVLECEGIWMLMRELRFLVMAANVVTLILAAAGYTNCAATDVGKQVKDDNVEVGRLLSYDNTTRVWVFESASTVASGSAMTITSGTGVGDADADSTLERGSLPNYDIEFGGTQTIYTLIRLLLEEAGATLDALGDQDDSIIDTYMPFFTVNLPPLENITALIGDRLIWMTKCYLRAEASKQFKVIYPQISDAVKETYYSDQVPYFKEYVEKRNLLIPNDIKVYYKQDSATGVWDATALANPGSATDTDEITLYTTVRQIFLVPNITTQDDANLRAAAILQRYKAETLAGRLVLPYHDCSVELYDKVEVRDRRGV
ncbi:unnamed protein product, partial [marine sediment metagenome]